MDNNGQVYQDRVLTNIFLGFQTRGGVAERLMPTLNVPDLTGIAFKLDESHLRAPKSSERTGFSRANRVAMNLDRVSYGPLREHSLEIGVTDDIMRLYQAPLTPEINATNVVVSQLDTEKEIAVRDQAVTATNYAAGFSTTLAGVNQWSDPTSPLESVISAARRKVMLGSGNYPNKLTLNPDVRDALRLHNEVKNRLVGAVAITDQQRDAIIADIFKVDEILLAERVTTNQAEGSIVDGTKNWVWSDDVVLSYTAPAPALETLSFGYLLRLDPEHAVSGAPLVGVDKWYEQQRKSTFIRANDHYLPWTVANTAAYLWKDVLNT